MLEDIFSLVDHGHPTPSCLLKLGVFNPAVQEEAISLHDLEHTRDHMLHREHGSSVRVVDNLTRVQTEQ